ncbi:MAG: tetratricopeptide repeat protein [Candidatus Aminicenantaceae bacterium]
MSKKSNVIMIIILCILCIVMLYPCFIYSQVFATVAGTVKSEDGKDIEGAKVILVFAEDKTTFELTTDKKGIWRKSNLRPGTWTVGFLAEGFEPLNLRVELSAVKENPPIDVRLSSIPESPLKGGDALYEQKEYAAALGEYQSVLEKHPDIHQVYNKIGLCYYRLNEFDKAIEYFKLMLAKEPQSQDTLINLSAIYLERGSLEEGMKYFKQLDETILKDKGLFYNIGILLFRNGQIDTAIEYLSKSIELDPNYVDAYYQLALANLNKGQMEEAKKNFSKVIELAPESDKAILAKKMLESIQ